MASALDFVVDKTSPVPLYHQVVQGLEAAIHAGVFPCGSQLDNETDLAAQLNVSRPTLRKAIEELVRSGLVARKQGRGSRVIATRGRDPHRLASHFDDMHSAGGNPTSEVLSFSHIEANAVIRESLSLPVRAHVYHFLRLRKVAGRPLALMENWVRDDIMKLEDVDLRSRGLYEILRSAGVDFRVANQRIGAVVANDYQAGLLQTTAGSALVTMERTALDETGRGVEAGRHFYRADSYTFAMTLVHRQ